MRNFIDLIEAQIHTLRTHANDNFSQPAMSDEEWDEMEDFVASLGRDRDILRKAGQLKSDSPFDKGQRVKFRDRYAKVLRSNGDKLALQYEDDGSIGYAFRRDPNLVPNTSIFFD